MKINDIWTGYRKSSKNTETRKDRLLMKCNLTAIEKIETKPVETEPVETEIVETEPVEIEVEEI